MHSSIILESYGGLKYAANLQQHYIMLLFVIYFYSLEACVLYIVLKLIKIALPLQMKHTILTLSI